MAAEPTFVTEQALETILKGYERLGASDENARKLDTQLRTFFERMSETASQTLRTQVDLKLDQLRTDLDKKISQSASVTQSQVSKETVEKISELKQAISEQVSSQLGSLIQTKTDQIGSQFSQEISRLRKDQEVESGRLSQAVDSKLEKISSSVNLTAKSVADEIAQKAISSVSSKMLQAIENALTEHTAFSVLKFNEFEAMLEKELKEKIVDREKIMSHIGDVERDLNSKTQAIINFQLEQARHMMEQAARAEMQGGMRDAVTSILSNLSGSRN